jgi:hypothetical protein
LADRHATATETGTRIQSDWTEGIKTSVVVITSISASSTGTVTGVSSIPSVFVAFAIFGFGSMGALIIV